LQAVEDDPGAPPQSAGDSGSCLNAGSSDAVKLGGRPRWGRLTLGFMADRDVLDVVEREIADEVRTRFPGDAVQRVRRLQYGDHPMIEPGDLWVRGAACRGPRGL